MKKYLHLDPNSILLRNIHFPFDLDIFFFELNLLIPLCNLLKIISRCQKDIDTAHKFIICQYLYNNEIIDSNGKDKTCRTNSDNQLDCIVLPPSIDQNKDFRRSFVVSSPLDSSSVRQSHILWCSLTI